MAELYLIYMLFQKIQTIMVIVCVLVAFLLLGKALYNLIRYDGFEILDRREILDKAAKHGKQFVIWLLIMVPFSVFFPSGKEILPYVILSEVDEYNIQHKESRLNPQNTIQLIDNTIQGVERIVGNLNKIVEKAVDKEQK